MGYSEQKYHTRVPSVFVPAVTFGTATASGASGHNAANVIIMPEFFRKTLVNSIRARCTVIPNAASTGLNLIIKNGTSTAGYLTLTTATVGQYIDATMTSSNATFAANTAPTATLIGTATASGAASGSFELFVETQEQP